LALGAPCRRSFHILYMYASVITNAHIKHESPTEVFYSYFTIYIEAKTRGARGVPV
jgi:hypothetical protein